MPQSKEQASATRRAFLCLTASTASGLVLGCSSTPDVVVPEIPPVPLPDDSPAKQFLGTYRFTGGEAERIAVNRAIDATVADMNGLIRGIARDKLAEANIVPVEISMVGGGNLLAVVVDRRPYVGRIDGIAMKVKTVTGDVMDMRYQLPQSTGAPPPPPQMEQVFYDNEKGRVNRFELRGAQLIMHVRVHATQLPRELLYYLTYEKG
ncbi:MAG: hypothetical protein IPM79_04060 [Polyangiaceae bacterium]|nr:hypothetical protein [Polyangiaceae bacterium]